MVFMCQKNSYLKELCSRVVSCESSTEPLVEYGRSTPFSGFALELEDTVLFPAGGGQPHDRGWIDDEPVLHVLRSGSRALHYVERPIDVDKLVTVRVDWARRFDHMQQHSGQHLLSALLDQCGLATNSWWLGAEDSYVSLAAPSVQPDVLADVENRCNQLIRQAVPVTVIITNTQDEGHTRGLPADCGAEVRVVNIGEIDRNLCCGTHVNNLSELQCIKLTGAESGKKGETNVKFVVGERALRTLQTLLDRQRALTHILKNDPSRHEELVLKLQRNLKLSNKSLQTTLTDLAQYEVDKYKLAEVKPKYLFLVRKDGTAEWARALCRGLQEEQVAVLVGREEPERPGEGHVLLQAPEPHCTRLAAVVTESLQVKGACKGGRLQGRAGDMGAAAVARCRKLIQQYYDNL